MRSKFYVFCLTLATVALIGCKDSAEQPKTDFIAENIEFSARQIQRMVDSMAHFREIPSPRTAYNDKIHYTTLDDWTSGFFPGSLWYLYELTGNGQWRRPAVKYTEGMERIKYYRGNHDIGFMIFCSFGNGYRLTGKESYLEVIVTAANTLCERYRPGAGIIQSWPPNSAKDWICPVIIDNMMNLELLFEATKISGDSTYWNIALSHADKTIEHQYRPDMSCYHVVDYDPETGAVRHQQTAQGFADESAWSRGQAWGLYGYTLCYRYTRNPKYLDQAQKIAKFWFSHPNLPEDLVPYWDFDAPRIPNEPRDASAAAVVGSALYELCTYVDGAQSKEYKQWADRILESLASPAYRAEPGKNGNFILMHSVGSIPHNTEIDVPLVYADYYFLEGLKRKHDLETAKQ